METLAAMVKGKKVKFIFGFKNHIVDQFGILYSEKHFNSFLKKSFSIMKIFCIFE